MLQNDAELSFCTKKSQLKKRTSLSLHLSAIIMDDDKVSAWKWKNRFFWFPFILFHSKTSHTTPHRPNRVYLMYLKYISGKSWWSGFMDFLYFRAFFKKYLNQIHTTSVPKYLHHIIFLDTLEMSMHKKNCVSASVHLSIFPFLAFFLHWYNLNWNSSELRSLRK